ncbi:unnamed protein product, partial [marine sediment metagenome]
MRLADGAPQYPPFLIDLHVNIDHQPPVFLDGALDVSVADHALIRSP